MRLADYTNTQIKALICEHIHSQRDRKLLFRRLVDGVSFERLGEEFELSVRQTKNIVYRHERKLQEYIT